MQQDEISQTIISYVQQHQRPDLALIPEHLTQGILDLLIEDTKHMAEKALEHKPNAGRYVTLAVLLLRAQISGNKRVDVSESDLKKNISRYTQLIYLENLQRQGVIKNLAPEIGGHNILENSETMSFDLTELGKRLNKENLQSVPDFNQG